MHCFYLVATLVHVTHGLINPKAKVAAPLVPTSGNVGSFSVADEKLPVAAVAVILIPGTNRMMVYDRPTQLGGTVLMDDNNKPTNSIQYDYKSKKFHPVGQSWEKQPEWVPFCSAGIVIPGGTGTEIITFGGVKANGVYTYDDNIGKSWNVKQYIESPRYYAGVVTLPSGHVMISGGGYDHVSDKALPDPGMTTIEFLPATKENFKVYFSFILF